MAIEIERRFLVKLPLPWYTRFKLHQCKSLDIVQSYLVEPPNSRVRRAVIHEAGIQDTMEWWLTTKTPIALGTNVEYEEKISAYQYAWKLPHKDKSLHEIWKMRYEIEYSKQLFELDVFKDRLRGLAILEIELDDIKQDVRLPPYIPIDREITGETEYSNYSLSKLNTFLPPVEKNIIEQ